MLGASVDDSSIIGDKKYLGAGVPRGASATSAPGAVAAPKLGAGLGSSRDSAISSLELWLSATSLQATKTPVLSR